MNLSHKRIPDKPWDKLQDIWNKSTLWKSKRTENLNITHVSRSTHSKLYFKIPLSRYVNKDKVMCNVMHKLIAEISFRSVYPKNVANNVINSYYR